MKRSSLIFICLILLAGAIYAGWYTNQVSTAKENATAAVNAYLDAIKVGNVEEAMRLSRDNRFVDEKARKEGYQELFESSPLQTAEIVTLERIDNANMTVTLSVKGESTGVQQITMPVIQFEETGEWKLLLDRMEIESPAQ